MKRDIGNVLIMLRKLLFGKKSQNNIERTKYGRLLTAFVNKRDYFTSSVHANDSENSPTTINNALLTHSMEQNPS
jgi:hypothetical protein